MKEDAVQQVQALTFDVFGTVVDWRGSIIREGKALGERKGIQADWETFADAWRGGYGPSMNRVRTGELPWTKIDDLHRMVLNNLLIEYGIEGLSEEEVDHFNRSWHRLDGWPDAADGLRRLRKRFTVATLSNGNVSLLANMAKYAGLHWDVVLSAELSRHYKPDPESYLSSAELLSLEPHQVMMVAAHEGDLRHAAAVGFRTAFVHRPLEFGAGREVEKPEAGAYDVVADDFGDMAEQLGV